MIISTEKRVMRLSAIARSYQYFKVVRLYNKNVAIVSRVPFNLANAGVIEIAETRKVPMSRVIMNVQMGRPYRQNEISYRTMRYSVVDTDILNPMVSLQVYEVVG